MAWDEGENPKGAPKYPKKFPSNKHTLSDCQAVIQMVMSTLALKSQKCLRHKVSEPKHSFSAAKGQVLRQEQSNTIREQTQFFNQGSSYEKGQAQRSSPTRDEHSCTHCQTHCHTVKLSTHCQTVKYTVKLLNTLSNCQTHCEAVKSARNTHSPLP